MFDESLALAVEKMQNAEVNPAAIAVFQNLFKKLASGATGLIPESAILPVSNPIKYEDLKTTEDKTALAQTVVIKLNGGLGTSMGLAKAKTMLPARKGLRFIDIIVREVLARRHRHNVKLPLLFMNSFNTAADTAKALADYPELEVDDLPLGFNQSSEPKLDFNTLAPVSWPKNPHLEWCPPGHGDLYPSLLASGILEKLLAAGYRYAFVSNSDNLGATACSKIAAWFATSGAPFVSEITKRTPMDVKGGHLAIRKSDNQLILRETAQTAKDDLKYFTDAKVHPYAHCNNLWLNLELIQQILKEKGLLDLPLIKNIKTVDPTDPNSTKVIQIESAMGAAVEVFPGALPLAVPRSRFIPVKSTNELFLLRSDVFELSESYTLRQTVPKLPVVELNPDYFKMISDFEARVAKIPSLKQVTKLVVNCDYQFSGNENLVGEVRL